MALKDNYFIYNTLCKWKDEKTSIYKSPVMHVNRKTCGKIKDLMIGRAKCIHRRRDKGCGHSRGGLCRYSYQIRDIPLYSRF